MTQEERIKQLEQEVFNLKEEVQKNRKANVWKKVKDKFVKDFDNFNWTYEWHSTNCAGEPLCIKRDMNESYHISQSIGTLVRIALKRKGLNWLEQEDEERAKEITEKILEIIKKEREITNEKTKTKTM